MKICFIAPYRDGTGYSKAAIEYMMALDSVGVDVVARPVKMTQTTGEIPDKILEMESKDLNGVDVCFQYNLPDEFVFKADVVNVGSYAYETDRLPHAFWQDHLELMDKIIIPCQDQLTALPDHLQEKAHVVGYSVELDKFDDDYEPIDFDLPDDCTKFYTISEASKRKNLPCLILAYLSTFSVDDNVALVIKTHVPHRDKEEGKTMIKSMIEEIKHGCRRFGDHARYPKIILITDYLSDHDINRIHYTCDNFVSASHGEAWCLPALDAMGFNNFVVAPGFGAFNDYLSVEDRTGALIKGRMSPVFGVHDAPPGLYSSDELWYNTDTHALGEVMRLVHASKEEVCKPEFKQKRRDKVESFSRINIGNKLKDILEDAIKTRSNYESSEQHVSAV